MKRKRPLTDNNDKLENKELDEGKNISWRTKRKLLLVDEKSLEKILFGDVDMKLL